MPILGRRLADERKRLGMSQQQLSEVLGIGRSALAMIETGKASIDADSLIDFGAHGIDVIYVLSGENSALAAARLMDWTLVETILRGVRTWSAERKISLSPEKEALVLKILYSRFATDGVIDEQGINETLRLAA